MTKQAQNSKINPEEIKPQEVTMYTPDYVKAGRGNTLIDTTQIRQKIKIGTFDITATGKYTMNIGYSPSYLEIKAYDTGHSPYSEAIISKAENHCIYKDSGGNYGEASTGTVVYLSHAGTTSAIISRYGPLFEINCNSYKHDATIHWIAHP